MINGIKSFMKIKEYTNSSFAIINSIYKIFNENY